MNTQMNATCGLENRENFKTLFENTHQFTNSREFRRNGWKNIILVNIGYVFDLLGRKRDFIVPFNVHTKLDIYDNWTAKKCRKHFAEFMGTRIYPCYEIIPIE